MANDETAFFRFGTNLDEVVSDIEANMARLRRVFSGAQGANLSPIQEGALREDASRMTQGMQRLERDLEPHVRRVRELLAQVGSGAINAEEFGRQFNETIRGAVRSIPQTLAQELALVPETTAKRLNAAGLAKDYADDYVNSLVREYQRGRPKVREALQGFKLDRREFASALGDLERRPVAYGSESLSADGGRLAQLINRSRAQQLLQEQYRLYNANEGAVPKEFTDRLKSTGFQRLVDELENEAKVAGRAYEIFQKNGPNKLGYIPDDTNKNLTEELRKRKEIGDQVERTAEAERLIVAAQEQLAAVERGSATRVGNRIVDENGGVTKLSGAGLEYARDQDAILKATEQRTKDLIRQMQADNYQRVVQADALGQVTKLGGGIGTGTYVLGRGAREEREVYQITGETAKRVTSEKAVTEALDAQDKVLARELTKSQRLVELDGKRILRDENNNAGFTGGFLNRFRRGEQSILTGLGGQVASASAFTAAYGSIFALQHAITDTIHEFQDYQDSLTDLQVATRNADVVTDGFVHNLGELARVSGANVGAALDTAARGIRAFGAGASKSDLQAIGEATNEAATKLSLIADKSLPDATGDLIASGSAFNLTSNQLNEVVDAVANAKRNVGGDAAQISQGLALIAGGAQEAGFSLNEAAAVIGLVQARTDQSGQAIATRLTRIFQIISGSTGKGLARELGVDPNQSVKAQIEAYAQIYANPNTTPAVKDRITSALGGTANLRELLPLLKENATLQNAYAEALSNSGQGTAEFQRKSENLVGILKKIKGDISAIQVELSKSGLAAPFGAAVRAAEPLLHLIDRILQGINKLPDGLQNTLGVMLDILAVAKALAVLEAHSVAGGLATTAGAYAKSLVGKDAAGVALKSAGPDVFQAAAVQAAAIEAETKSRLAAEQRFNLIIDEAAAQRAVAEREAAAAAVLGGGKVLPTLEGAAAARLGPYGRVRGFLGANAERAGIAGGLSRLGLFATNPYTLLGTAAIGGLLYANKALDGASQERSFLNKNVTAQGQLGKISLTSTSADIKQVAEDINSAAGNVKKAKSNLFSSGTQKDVAKALEGEADVLKQFAADAAAEEARLAKKFDTGVFGNGRIETVGQLADGIKALTEAGANGTTIMRKFAQALNEPAKKAEQIARPDAIADILATGFNANLSKLLGDKTVFTKKSKEPFTQINPVTGKLVNALGEPTTGVVTRLENVDKVDAIRRLQLSAEEISAFKADVLREAARRGITEGSPMTDAQVDSLISYAVDKLPLDDIPKTADKVRAAMFNYWRQRLGTAPPAPPHDLAGLLKQGVTVTAEQQNGLLNGKGKLSSAQLLSLFNPSDDGKYPGLQALLQGNLNAVPKSDDGRLLAQAQGLNRRILGQLVKRGGADTPQVLRDLYNNAVHDFAETTIDNLERLRRAAQNKPGLSRAQIKTAGIDALKKEISAAGRDTNLLISIMDRADDASLKVVRAALVRAAQLAKAAQEFAFKLTGFGALLQLPGFTLPKTKAEKDLDAFDKANSESNHPTKGSVYSTGSDAANYVAPEKPEKKSAEELKQERIRYLNALDQLKGDLTDPVEQARDALRAARRAVQFATSKADRAEARVDVRRSRNELEAAKFSQRLSDVQIADELGRISHSKYIAYLEHEHDRLNAIKHRTRQQQDQLNEIDLALKSAKDAMDGQFNLGDINTNGLVYQVRRQMAEARAAAASSSLSSGRATTQQTITYQINGADTAMVKKVISQYLNVSANPTNTLVRRKV